MAKRSTATRLSSAVSEPPAQRPLPLRQRRAEGKLLLASGSLVKTLWFRDGRVLFAASSHRGDSLWAFLLRERMVHLDVLREVAFERASRNRPYGALLLERGLLAPKALHQTIQHQIEHIVRSVFALESATVDLLLGPTHETQAIQIALPLPRLVLDGCRHGAAASSWRTRLGGGEIVLLADTTSELLIDLAVDADELALLRLADGSRTLADICTEGPFEPDENGRVLYALASLGLLRRAAPD
jgi:hypothetical protein